ncbi:MAG: S-adenosylmethionine:tRNA ribosyltransferase-isomerase [Paludibacteraceae bacterium]|nr:S-adenosylmethionine:tRNA ribosyltransferase-isomerase [Paludibacteraceae bacterium]
MMNIKEIRIEDFDYALPDERIAKYPLEERDSSNLLYWRNGTIEKMHFYDLPDLLSREHLLIYNNTKVIQARLHFQKETGATIEIFCLEPHSPADYNLVFQENKSCVWKCLVGNSKKWKEGALKQTMSIRNILFELRAVRIESANEGMSHLVRFEWDNEDILFSDILSHFGELPIPPYLNRATEEKDKETYQTVYSKIDGSVAAPTAGLHFTKDVLRQLALNGVREDEVTLHVGAGTFQPVKSEEIGDHPMHREIISVSKRVIENLIASEGHIVAVGTTSVRTLESLYYLGCRIARNPENPNLMVEQWEPYENDYTLTTREALQTIVDYLNSNHLAAINAATRIMIVPSFQFRVVNKIITNFHQPKSTLLLLISAFVGIDRWRKIYEFAMDNGFRFLSYGDSSLLERN